MRPYLKGDFWATVWIHQMKLVTKVGLGLGHIVLDADPAPPPPNGHSPQFSAHICCGQMAGWIKTPLGREVGLGPSDIVLDGDLASPPQKGSRAPAPNFRPMSIVGKRLYGSDQDATCYGGRPQPRPSFPPPKGAQPLIFGPCLLWPYGWMDQDVTWYKGRPRHGQRCV